MSSSVLALMGGGGGGALIGQPVLMQNAPISVTQGSQEFLKIGSVKSYASDYAASLALAPQLRVFGTPANTYGSTSTSVEAFRYLYVGTNYVSTGSFSSALLYASSLANLSASPTASSGAGSAITSKTPTLGGNARLAQGNGYLVVPNGVNSPLAYTTDGIAYFNVGGTFTSFLESNAGAYCGALGWIFLQSLAGSGASTRGYIANTNPTGAWTTDAGTNLGMTTCHSIASNGAVIVAVGVSSSATAGKIATATAVSGAFTDRTSASGITFTAAESVFKVVWTGARFVALTDTARIITSTDGINWSLTDIAFDTSGISPVGSGSQSAYRCGDMVTDGAGKVIMLDEVTSAGMHPLVRISTDHGLTFQPAQVFIGKHGQSMNLGVRTVSYANGKFIFNLAGMMANFVDAGSVSTPDYVGQQVQFAQGFSVRIK